MRSQSLSKASEKKILDALEKVSGLTNAGEHPNDAIIKIATQMQIPAGHVRLMVNAVNTGRTNAHRLTSDDPFEKAAEFPLADVQTVLEALYPSEVQTKTAAHLENVVADDYRRGPKWLKEKAAHEKAARAVEWKLTDKKPTVERDPDYVVKKAVAHVQKLHQNLEAQRLELAMKREHAIKLASNLRTYFKQPGHIPFDEVTENAEIMFGKVASVVLQFTRPEKEGWARSTPTPVDQNIEPYSLIKEAVAVATEFKQSQEAYTAAVKTANDESRQVLRPFGPGPAQGHSVMADLCWTTPTKAAGLGSMIENGFGLFTAGDIAKEIAKKMPGHPGLGTDVEKRDLQTLMDPGHEAEIRNIQAEAMLNDLLANDDVIKGYDPEEVVDSYNEINQIAPYAANKKVIMRDLMRKRLAGGPSALDQFTVGDTIGQQEKLRNSSLPTEPQLNVLKDLGVMPGASSHNRSVLGGR
jgi:hypothetical protein